MGESWEGVSVSSASHSGLILSLLHRVLQWIFSKIPTQRIKREGCVLDQEANLNKDVLVNWHASLFWYFFSLSAWRFSRNSFIYEHIGTLYLGGWGVGEILSGFPQAWSDHLPCQPQGLKGTVSGLICLYPRKENISWCLSHFRRKSFLNDASHLFGPWVQGVRVGDALEVSWPSHLVVQVGKQRLSQRKGWFKVIQWEELKWDFQSFASWPMALFLML